MNLRRVLAILTKDLRDAWRDGRIIVLLLFPIGLAVFTTIANQDEQPTTRVAVVDRGAGGVAQELDDAAGESTTIRSTQARNAASARGLVAEAKVDLAIIVAPTSPARSPRADVLVAADASPDARSVVELVPTALARAADLEPAAQTRVRAVAPTDRSPADVIGPRALSALIPILLLVAFVAMLVVPMQMAEELETGTFHALRLAATAPEILAAKALSGYIYGMAGVSLTVAATQLDVHAPLVFFGAAFALIVSLVGFGLLLGLLVPNLAAINTYGGFLIAPIVFLAGAVFAVDSAILTTILDGLPLSQAAKLLGDGASPQAPFDAGPIAWLVIVAWALVGYVILAQIASRREI